MLPRFDDDFFTAAAAADCALLLFTGVTVLEYKEEEDRQMTLIKMKSRGSDRMAFA